MVSEAVGSRTSVGHAVEAARSGSFLEGIIARESLAPARGKRQVEAMLRKPAAYAGVPFLFVTDYSAGERLELPISSSQGYSAVEVLVGGSSERLADNVGLKGDTILIAATHAMWAEPSALVTVAYAGPFRVSKKGITVYFDSAWIIPNGNEVKLAIAGNKVVPELKVLSTPHSERIVSPDIVVAGNQTFYDIAQVTVRSGKPVKLSRPEAFDQTILAVPRSRLHAASCYIGASR